MAESGDSHADDGPVVPAVQPQHAPGHGDPVWISANAAFLPQILYGNTTSGNRRPRDPVAGEREIS
jgi:hypothetical protein